MKSFFRAHGEFCVSHPWEVIVATLTLTACMLTMDQQQHISTPSKPLLRNCPGCLNEAEYNAADLILMTFIRCMAILCSYYQFCNLHRLGSKSILVIAGLFTVFSSLAFTSTVLNFLKIDVADLKDALFFFLLLIDLSKAATLAEFALSASSHHEVKSNIARGMSILGPSITLDTIVETLVIGVGTLSGVQRLEMLSYYACLSVLVNYVIFMTFYPACLSLILELTRTTNMYEKRDWCLISKALRDEDQKSNPVLQRVKIIMSAGLMLVHVQSRWFITEDNESAVPQAVEQHISMNRSETTPLHGYIMKWITLSADHIVILILLLALVAKFIFFENKQLINQTTKKLENNTDGCQHCSNLNKELRRKFMPAVPFFAVASFDKESPDDKTTEVLDKEVQTDVISYNEIPENVPIIQPPRSVEECLEIYNKNLGAEALTDQEVINLVKNKHIAAYQLEKAVGNPERGVAIRRKIIAKDGKFEEPFEALPYKNYDYSKVMGACCENVIGYVPLPLGKSRCNCNSFNNFILLFFLGVAGPLLLDGQQFQVPMATTEGCLVASTNRGCRALLKCGVKSSVVADGMTRGPVVRFPTATKASEAALWFEKAANYDIIKESFDATSRFGRLTKIHTRIAGRHLFIRFVAKTGDAMGMNMISKGTEQSLKLLQTYFPDMEILSLSGNFCTDKKPAAVNW